MARWQYLEGDTLTKQYKEHLSDFRQWEQEVNVEALIFPENFGNHMSIDEIELWDGYYTCITNKAGHGKKRSLAALIKGTQSKVVTKALEQVPFVTRLKVKELTLDFANSMDWIARTNFPQAVMVGDRFHAQKLVNEAVQEIRIQLKREWIDTENELIALARQENRSYREERLANGDTRKQLLCRCNRLLTQPKERWKEHQVIRAGILFDLYPDLEHAYHLAMLFRNMYEKSKTRIEAQARWQEWQYQVSQSGIPQMRSMVTNLRCQETKILAFFPNRSTNAGAESFNSKLKGFRTLLRGITDINFFLYRVCNLFA